MQNVVCVGDIAVQCRTLKRALQVWAHVHKNPKSGSRGVVTLGGRSYLWCTYQQFEYHGCIPQIEQS